MDITGRLPRLRAMFDRAGIDALLVTSLTNVRYLTGFSGSAAMLVVKTDETVLITDGRYAEQSGGQLAEATVDARVAIGNQIAQREHASAAMSGIARIGLEAEHVSWARRRTLGSEWFPDAELVATEGLVEEMRRVKDDGEVARIAEAARIADDAFAKLMPRVSAGSTERELAAELNYLMRSLGADGVSFDTIVAAGPNGARPHAEPTDRPIGRGELIVVDFGALVDGYHSDMTRTICVGEPTDSAITRMFEVVSGAQRAGLAALKAGVDAAAVDAACRAVITDAGWGDAFVHSTGHGVGLDIHEYPLLGTTSMATLEAGYVVTVEPGVYLPTYGGVRIEDTVVVTDTAYHMLTHAPKDLVIS